MQETSLVNYNLKKPTLKSPIFIVGSPRSGTTYLRKILEKHPGIFTFPGETHILTNFKVNLSEYLNKFEAENDIDNLIMSVMSASKYGNDCAAIFAERKIYPLDIRLEHEGLKKLEYIKIKNRYDALNTYVTYTAAKENKTKWVEKTQSNIHNIPEIIKRFPNALFVEIYRDPRAVYYSWLHAKQLYFRESTVTDFIYRWKSAVNDGLKYSKQFASQYYRIKYENLIENPEYEISKLCKFIGETPAKEMFNITPDDCGFDHTTGNETWKKCLQAYEKLYIDLLTKRERKVLNYRDSEAKLTFLNFIQLFIFSLRSLIQTKFYMPFINNCINTVRDIYKQIKTTMKRYFLMLSSNRRKIFSYLRSAQEKKLLISIKNISLDGWLCANINSASDKSIILNSTKQFPFEDNIFDCIFISQSIEYLKYNQSKHFLNECFRVLKPGGKIRIITINLENFIKIYSKKEPTKEEKEYMKLVIDSCMPDIGIYKNAFIMNSLFNRLNYKFIYDYESINDMLEKIGFIYICSSNLSNSKYIEFADINLNFSPRNDFETLVIEARKP